MAKCRGITESLWGKLSEDERFYWKSLCRAVGVIAILFVPKASNSYFDWVFSVLTAVFAFIVIETQRSYSKFSPRLRRANVRVAITIGSWGIAVVGMAFFAQVGVVSIADTFVQKVAPRLRHSGHPLTPYLLLSAFAVAVPVATMRVLRETQFEQLIYHLPRKGLKNLFMHKYPRAGTFLEFAQFELSIILGCFVYSTAVGIVANALLVFL